MIKCIEFTITKGKFFAHYFEGKNEHLLVFIPGLMEPKAGLFYIWSEMARNFNKLGYNCLLFDLAGQGDSLFPLSFELWYEQQGAILNYFSNKEIHFIVRGIGSVLLTHDHINFAINPSLLDPIKSQFKHIRWVVSPFSDDLMTPSNPNGLSDIERECFYSLGAEAECIGGLQLNMDFIKKLPLQLPSALPNKTLCYRSAKEHPLFDKQLERDILFKKISCDLLEKIS